MMHKYPEIQALQELYDSHEIQIRMIDGIFLGNKPHYPKVHFTTNSNSFELYVDDEYDDLALGNPLLSLCLVLRELEDYGEEDDILTWCKSKTLDSNDTEVLTYYKALSHIYFQVVEQIGAIDSYIPDLDFQLNAGAAQVLRIKKT